MRHPRHQAANKKGFNLFSLLFFLILICGGLYFAWEKEFIQSHLDPKIVAQVDEVKNKIKPQVIAAYKKIEEKIPQDIKDKIKENLDINKIKSYFNKNQEQNQEPANNVYLSNTRNSDLNFPESPEIPQERNNNFYDHPKTPSVNNSEKNKIEKNTQIKETENTEKEEKEAKKLNVYLPQIYTAFIPDHFVIDNSIEYSEPKQKHYSYNTTSTSSDYINSLSYQTKGMSLDQSIQYMKNALLNAGYMKIEQPFESKKVLLIASNDNKEEIYITLQEESGNSSLINWNIKSYVD